MKITKYNFTLLIVVVSVLIGGAFYWYEWRPTTIKKSCNTQAQDKARGLLKDKYEMTETYSPDKDTLLQIMHRGLFLKDDYEEYYKKCLREKGYNRQ